MAIEIKELIIRTTIQSAPAKERGISATQLNAIRREILAECKDQIKEVLKEQKER